MLLFAGELAAAASLVEEVQVVTRQREAASRPTVLWPSPRCGAAKPRCRAGQPPPRTKSSERGEGIGIGLADWATAVLHNGLGHYENALAAAETASAYLAT